MPFNITRYVPGATFSKLLRKILGRFLSLGKDLHFQYFLGRSSSEDLPKYAFSKLLWKDFRKICRKALALSYKRKLHNDNIIFTKARHVGT